MKLYSLTVMYRSGEGQVKRLCASYELNSFGYFQRSRSVSPFKATLGVAGDSWCGWCHSWCHSSSFWCCCCCLFYLCCL